MVRVDDLPIALLAFLAFVVMSPIWVRYLQEFSAPRPEDAFLAAMVLPAAAALFVASWVSTEIARLVLGLFMLAGVMVLAPWLFSFIELLGTELTGQPLAGFILALAVPVIVLSFLVQIGKRRLVQNG